MENSGDIVPFMKEVLKEGPSRNMVKIYALGSALTLFGKNVFCPFFNRMSDEVIN
uniref:Uncharacterized protein n=1 Tax=Oryzias sinensis TaxID=183150 RepID=A0A8C7Y3N3_9TELE